MSSSPAGVVVRSRGLGKAYGLFDRPADRLRELFRSPGAEGPDRFWAVRGIDLDVMRGETVGIVGCNGSGKSTLLEMLSGILEPSEGELEVNGRAAALLELGAGFNPEFTGRENVRLAAAILGMDGATVAARFEEIVAFADIGDFLDRPVKTYSSGMFARLAFAVAIHAAPDLLIIDEILSVGDEAFQRKCFAKIEEFKRAGGSILLVSHAAGTVVGLCDRVLLLDRGQALIVGEPKRVVDLYQRLSHAAPEQAEFVRARILEVGREAESSAAMARAEANAEAEEEVETIIPPEMESESAESSSSEGLSVLASVGEPDPARFDPELISESRAEYHTKGAEILDPGIFSSTGEAVNCLAPGRRYALRYRVRFDRDVADARYHTLIKTVEGLELGGGTHPPLGSPPLCATAGSEIEVEFQFRCALNSGVYFVNCGVTDGASDQLHRIIDALAIRVLTESEPSTFGHVHFDHRARIEPLRPAQAVRG